MTALERVFVYWSTFWVTSYLAYVAWCAWVDRRHP